MRKPINPTHIEKLLKISKKLALKPKQILATDDECKTHDESQKMESLEQQARKDLQIAETMASIAEAMKLGKTKFLSRIRKKAHVQILEELLNVAKQKNTEAKGRETKFFDFVNPELVDIADVEYPYPRVGSLHLRHIQKVKDIEELSSIAKSFSKIGTWKDWERGFVFLEDPFHIRQLERVLAILKPLNTHDWLIEIMASFLANYYYLQEMGITCLSTLRPALQEYLAVRVKYFIPNPIRQQERSLLKWGIKDYHPMPKQVVEKMVKLADIRAGMDVLQARAGTTRIADSIRKNYSDVNLTVLENESHLTELIKTKGYNLIDCDFYEHENTYHRIITSSPYDGGWSKSKVQRAYDLLNPNGKLVAVINEQIFSDTDKHAVSFRKWLKKRKAIIKRLPVSYFPHRYSSMKPFPTRLVVIEKQTFF